MEWLGEEWRVWKENSSLSCLRSFISESGQEWQSNEVRSPFWRQQSRWPWLSPGSEHPGRLGGSLSPRTDHILLCVCAVSSLQAFAGKARTVCSFFSFWDISYIPCNLLISHIHFRGISYIHRVVQLSPLVNFRTFSSPRKGIPYPLRLFPITLFSSPWQWLICFLPRDFPSLDIPNKQKYTICGFLHVAYPCCSVCSYFHEAYSH